MTPSTPPHPLAVPLLHPTPHASPIRPSKLYDFAQCARLRRLSRHRNPDPGVNPNSFSSSTAPPSPAISSATAVATFPNSTRTDPSLRPHRLPSTSTTSGSSLSFKSNPYESSSSSSLSLANLRSSLSEAPVLYPFPELCAATNNFLAKRLPGASSSVWRCTLRSRDVVVIQRPFRPRYGDMAAVLPARLAALCRSHHSSLARLLGASSADDHVYLVYEFVPGASLADCLRNPQNPSFTPLASWISRVQVAIDVAQGLEYIHHHSPASGVHNGITSSAIVVTEPDFRAKICYFGAADLTGEIPVPHADAAETISISSPSSATKRSGERQRHIKGTRGYMAPEVLTEGAITRRSDVFAFGVVLLELLSGEEPLNYRYDRERKEFDVVSVIDTARAAVGGEDEEVMEEGKGRVRRWLDRRLKDSFPVEVAEKLIRVALRCVEAQSAARPEMTWVAGKVSKLYLESKAWAGKVKVPTDFSVSMAPR